MDTFFSAHQLVCAPRTTANSTQVGTKLLLMSCWVGTQATAVLQSESGLLILSIVCFSVLMCFFFNFFVVILVLSCTFWKLPFLFLDRSFALVFVRLKFSWYDCSLWRPCNNCIKSAAVLLGLQQPWSSRHLHTVTPPHVSYDSLPPDSERSLSGFCRVLVTSSSFDWETLLVSIAWTKQGT